MKGLDGGGGRGEGGHSIGLTQRFASLEEGAKRRNACARSYHDEGSSAI